VWLGFFLYEVLGRFSALARQHGDLSTVRRYQAQARKLQQNLEKHGWDARRGHYIRAYADSGQKVQFNDAIVQGWAALSGAARPERASRALRSAVKGLYRPDDKMILLFDEILEDQEWGGSLRAYPSGLRENNAQYTHGSAFLVRGYLEWLRAQLRQGRLRTAKQRAAASKLAMELYGTLLSTTHGEDPRYGGEPWATPADIYGGDRHGEAGWTWYSGASGWIYRTGIETVLGLKLEGGRTLFIDPLIPSDWPAFQATVRKGGARYEIDVQNPERVLAGVKRILVDGVSLPRPADGVSLIDDGKRHRVEVIMGAAEGR
jgi:cyclic beta-1,2-glucan synthetase